MSDQGEFVDGIPAAMDAITEPGFDPSERVVMNLPTDVFTCVGRCVSPDAPTTTRTTSASELTIQLPPQSAGVLTVRNAYDTGWRATADGLPAETLPVDGFLQGVILPPGTRDVVLTYHDDAVLLGLALGVGIWLVLLGAPLFALAVERLSRRRAAEPD